MQQISKAKFLKKDQEIILPTAEQKASNTEKSRIRSRVEHIFGAQAHMGQHFIRTIGILRASLKIGMMNLAYNMIRLGQLIKRDGIAASAVT